MEGPLFLKNRGFFRQKNLIVYSRFFRLKKSEFFEIFLNLCQKFESLELFGMIYLSEKVPS